MGLSSRIAAASLLLLGGAPHLAPRSAVAQIGAPVSSSVARETPLTLGDIYATVERRSPRLRAAVALALASETRIAGARRPPDPTVQVGWMNYMLPEFGADPALGMRQVQVMQMVPLPGKLSAAGDAAAARAAVADARVAEVRWDLRAAAATTFYARSAALQQVAIASETRRLLEDVADIAAAMYRVGDGRQADVLRSRVEIARMDEEIVLMTVMGESALARLAALVDLPPDSVAAPPMRPTFPDALPTREEMEELALASRPMLAAGVAEAQAASAEVRFASRERWPDFQVGVQYGERSTAMGTDRMGSVMVGASVPIWARARQVGLRREAIAMSAMAEADLAEMRAATRGRVGEVHAELVSSRRLAVLYRATILPQAEAAAEAALSSFRTGAVDLLTVIENRLTINRYRMELVALDAAEGRAWAELEMLAGQPLLAAAAVGRRERSR
ncbi:MAG: TolC family protein [Gemmatimonadaceae bacterium]